MVEDSDEDVFCELVKFGNLLEMHVCDNVGDHLIGNVYARYDFEEQAANAVQALNQRWYAGTSPPFPPRFRSPIDKKIQGRPLIVELSPVTDFREACCRQNDLGECNRGGFCNFMHLRKPTEELVKQLQREQRVERKGKVDPLEEERKKESEMFSGGGGGYEGGRR